MKRFFILMIALCAVLLSSCTVYVGDVEDDVPDVKVEKIDETAVVDVQTENDEEEAEAEEKNEPLVVNVDELLGLLGYETAEFGEYDYVDSFEKLCDVIKDTDKTALAEMITDAPKYTPDDVREYHPEYFDEFDELEIDSYKIYKCIPKKEKMFQMHYEYDVSYLPLVCFVVFNVTQSNIDDVRVGENACFISVNDGPAVLEYSFVRSKDNVFEQEKIDELFFYRYQNANSPEEEYILCFAEDFILLC